MGVNTGFRVRRKWGARGRGFLCGGQGTTNMMSMGSHSLLCGKLRGHSSLLFYLEIRAEKFLNQ